MNDKRLFTVKEANELIPFLSDKLQEMRVLREKLGGVSEQAPSQQEITLHGGTWIRPDYFALLARFQSSIEAICAEGCHLKDLESGLIDFPTLWEGREVYLCWKLGEDEVGHWHEIEAGFAGRQSLKTGPAF